MERRPGPTGTIRHYKSPAFATLLLDTLRALNVPSWSNPDIVSSDLNIHKVSGSLTNAVFFVSCPSIRGIHTILLRIYGSSSGSLISRPKELHTLHLLSSQYHIGPRVYGTFDNGRVEEFFDSTTLTASDIRVPKISRWIAARMAELHSVDIASVEARATPKTGWYVSAAKNVELWYTPAQRVLALSTVSDGLRKDLDLNSFREEWNRYLKWLTTVEDVSVGSRRVFAHNDTQYGNLLRLKHLREGRAEHTQIVVVDFEYAAPNPAAFDIANHFHEWTANYHGDTPHILDVACYPTLEERYNFYDAYIRHSYVFKGLSLPSPAELEAQVRNMEQEVRLWSPASHGMWAIWGIVQAREDVEEHNENPEFDYLAYARCRMAAFRRDLAQLL
ncbi:kinase-like protein [Pluteus cervinus]|uniref:Kinase-like protein n=1 Tax=Pluteus cervinus TaxID=181527 RepID=A0ACD3BFC4_9AGAR|nr:kinase-like protein [Pluteus cervinus]